MSRPVILLALLVACAAGGGCLGGEPGSTSTNPTSATTATTTETTTALQTTETTTADPTTVGSTTRSTPSTTESQELVRHPYVVMVDVSQRANATHDVTVRLDPSEGKQFEETAAVGPGGGFNVDREHDSYRVTIIVDGRTVLENGTVGVYEAIHVEVEANGEVAMALSQV